MRPLRVLALAGAAGGAVSLSGLASGGCTSSSGGAPAPSGSTAAITGQVVDATGKPLGGASVTSGSASARSDAGGNFALTVPAGPAVVVAVHEAGYVGSIKRWDLSSGGAIDMRVALVAATPPVPLDATAGGTVQGPRGASLAVPPGALVDASGHSVSGTVQVSLTPFDPTDAAELETYPASLDARTSAGASVILGTYGILDVQVTQNGQELQVKKGAKLVASTRAPAGVATPPASAPTWSLAVDTGLWQQEGTATLDATKGVYTFSLPHLSDWNVDDYFNPACICGRVVDAKKNPVVGALVQGISPLPPAATCADDPSQCGVAATSAYTSGDGTFIAPINPTSHLDVRIWQNPLHADVFAHYPDEPGPTKTISEYPVVCKKDCQDLGDLSLAGPGDAGGQEGGGSSDSGGSSGSGSGSSSGGSGSSSGAGSSSGGSSGSGSGGGDGGGQCMVTFSGGLSGTAPCAPMITQQAGTWQFATAGMYIAGAQTPSGQYEWDGFSVNLMGAPAPGTYGQSQLQGGTQIGVVPPQMFQGPPETWTATAGGTKNIGTMSLTLTSVSPQLHGTFSATFVDGCPNGLADVNMNGSF